MKKEVKEKTNKHIVIEVLITTLLIISVSINMFLLNEDVKKENAENIVFFGNSITERYEVSKYFHNKRVINDGKGGNKTEDLIDRIQEVYDYNPSQVFILVGINDLKVGVEQGDILNNIQTIINGIKFNRKYTKIFVESVYPINEEIINNSGSVFIDIKQEDINKFNNKLKQLCDESKVTYIDINTKLRDNKGNLKKLYTEDGVHLNNLGYLKVTSVLDDYVK